MALRYELPPLVLFALAAFMPVVMSQVITFIVLQYYYLPIFTFFTVAILSLCISIWTMFKVPVKPSLKKILITIYTPIMGFLIIYLTFPRSTHGDLQLF